MGKDSINGAQMSVRTIKTLDEIKALNISRKTKDFLCSVFNELDTTDSKGNKIGDNILQQNEGSIYVFGDGSVSIMKNDKFYAGTSAEGAEVRADGDTLNATFSDGSTSVMKDDKLISGTTDKGNAYTIKDGALVFDKKTTENEEKTIVENQKNTTESSKIQHNDKAAKNSSKINGVYKSQLDDIAKEYQQLTRSNYKRNDKLNFYLKHLKTISKALKKHPSAYSTELLKNYKPEQLETDNYIMQFSPVMNPNTFKFYWELYDVKEKRKQEVESAILHSKTPVCRGRRRTEDKSAGGKDCHAGYYRRYGGDDSVSLRSVGVQTFCERQDSRL